MKKNFNLIELIIVIVCLAILVAIIIPNISNIKQKASDAKLAADLRNAQTMVDMYYTENGAYPTAHQPLLTNEEIDWGKLIPDYARNKPKYETDKTFYVDPNGTVVLNYNSSAEFLHWLKYSKMIVEDPNDPVYNGMQPPRGTVFLNYDLNNDTFTTFSGEYRVLTLASASVGDALLEAYTITKDPIFLNRATAIGERLDSQIFEEYFYGDPTLPLYLLPGMSRYQNGMWVDFREESPVNTMAITSKFLVRLGMLTDNQYFIDSGLKLLDTILFIQNRVSDSFPEIKGAITEKFFNNEGIYIASWNDYPLDIAYMIVDASDMAYKATNNSKYLNLKNSFIQFVENVMDDPVIKGKSPYGFPYEYIVLQNDGITFKGENKNQLSLDESGNPISSENEPFTTDQFFYIALGLERANSPKAYELYQLMKNKLVTGDYDFWGQYNIDGTKDENLEVHYETVNSAFYLEFVKKYNPENVKDMVNSLFKKMYANKENQNSHMGVTWDNNISHIEALASAFMAQKILEQIY